MRHKLRQLICQGSEARTKIRVLDHRPIVKQASELAQLMFFTLVYCQARFP